MSLDILRNISTASDCLVSMGRYPETSTSTWIWRTVFTEVTGQARWCTNLARCYTETCFLYPRPASSISVASQQAAEVSGGVLFSVEHILVVLNGMIRSMYRYMAYNNGFRLLVII